MAFEVLMPQLGLTMEEGTVSQWIKHEGDEVKTGDVIVEITTDKLTNEVASEHDGVLLKIVAQEGEDIPVKGLLAYIGQPGEAVPGAAPAAAPAAEPAPAPSQQNEKTVYVTKTGKRYHYDSSCNGGTYYPSTLTEALNRGLTPCQKCIG